VAEEEQKWVGSDAHVQATADDGSAQGCQLPTELARVLEERVDHPSQEVYVRVEGELLETVIQPLTRVWLEEEGELSLQKELEVENCCELEEGEGQP
jgi:hypothetical protein